MPKIAYTGKWSKAWQKEYNVPKGFFLVRVDDLYHKPLGDVLNKLIEWQEKKGELRELDFTLEYHYRKRSIGANNLMWALYTIEANELNAGMSAGKGYDVTPESLYEADLEQYSKRYIVVCELEAVLLIKANYRVVKEELADDRAFLTIMKTSSQFDTREMAEWIDRIFNRLAVNGVSVTQPGDILKYWSDWRRSLDENRIVLNDLSMTEDEYKARTPICEACSKYIGAGGGSLFHINARGMGGNPEPSKQRPSNWLHTCDECHMNEWHNGTPEVFVKKFPHLQYKIETALRRDYRKENEKEDEDPEKIKEVSVMADRGESGYCLRCGGILRDGESCGCDEADIF